MVDELQELLNSAIEDHRRGDVAAAVAKYETFAASRPDQWDAVYLYGTALIQSRRFREAIGVFQRVAAARPDVPDVQNNLGVAYQELGDWESAERSYQAAVNLQANYDRAHFNLGRLMENRQRFSDAENAFRSAAQLKPAEAGYIRRLSDVLVRQSKWEEAETVLRQGIAANPDNLDLRINLGFVLYQRERLDEAVEIYRSVLARQPNYHQVYSNLGLALERQGRLEEGLAAAQRSVEIRPDYAEGFNNLGMVLLSLHRLEEACQAFRKALEQQPDFPLAEFNLGTTLLLAGDYRKGWTGYRHHTIIAGTPLPGPASAEWNGRPIPGKRLLAYADQGFGDAIQFARFLCGCKELSRAHVILRCQPGLVRLFAGLPGTDEIVSESAADLAFDFHVSLAALPRLLGVTIETARIGVPYIPQPAALRAELEELLARGKPADLRIGLVWQGNPRQNRDVLRSCPFARLLPLLDRTGVQFFSLQTGDLGRNQMREQAVSDRLIDVGGAVRDFAETAAVVARLDLLIAVDTAVAHLAGAMGRPVWTLLCHTPDWRWHLSGSDCAWYPTMRLFRQPRWGDWSSVITALPAFPTSQER